MVPYPFVSRVLGYLYLLLLIPFALSPYVFCGQVCFMGEHSHLSMDLDEVSFHTDTLLVMFSDKTNTHTHTHTRFGLLSVYLFFRTLNQNLGINF